MLSAWALFMHSVVILCSLLLLQQAIKWDIRMRMRLIIGVVGLHSLFQVGGFGERLVGAINRSSLFTGALCLVMIFLIREAVGEKKLAALQLRLKESRFRHPWELAPPNESLARAAYRPSENIARPSDRRKWERHPVHAIAKVRPKSGKRMVFNGLIDDIGLKGMRLRLPEPIPIPSITKIEVQGHTFLGVVRYCETTPDNKEFYAGIEFEQHLDPAVLRNFLVRCSLNAISANAGPVT